IFVVPLLAACNQQGSRNVPQEVVIYSSVDDIYARPLCERFSQATGIEVKLVPDTEETKSTGLLNRLIAEKSRPQADVFWSSDPMRAAVVQKKSIAAPYLSSEAPGLRFGRSDPEGQFTAFSARMRVIIFNRNR